MFVSRKLPSQGSRGEGARPRRMPSMTKGTSATYVRPSAKTSGRVPVGKRWRTASGSTGQWTNVRSRQTWSKTTGGRRGGGCTGKPSSDGAPSTGRSTPPSSHVGTGVVVPAPAGPTTTSRGPSPGQAVRLTHSQHDRGDTGRRHPTTHDEAGD